MNSKASCVNVQFSIRRIFACADGGQRTTLQCGRTHTDIYLNPGFANFWTYTRCVCHCNSDVTKHLSFLLAVMFCAKVVSDFSEQLVLGYGLTTSATLLATFAGQTLIEIDRTFGKLTFTHPSHARLPRNRHRIRLETSGDLPVNEPSDISLAHTLRISARYPCDPLPCPYSRRDLQLANLQHTSRCHLPQSHRRRQPSTAQSGIDAA